MKVTIYKISAGDQESTVVSFRQSTGDGLAKFVASCLFPDEEPQIEKQEIEVPDTIAEAWAAARKN